MNAAARGAVADVWNSDMYEYPADVAPATLFCNGIQKRKDLLSFHWKFSLNFKWNTNDAPAKNRSTINIYLFTANADENEKMNAIAAANRSTFFRPHVSDRKPHKCEENTIPKYDIPLRTPCSLIDSSRSHFAYGKT